MRDMRFVSEDNERRFAEPGNDLLCLRVINFCSSGGFHRDLDIFVTNSCFSDSHNSGYSVLCR